MTEIRAADRIDADDSPAPQVCGCGHPVADHDVIAVRFCDATLAGVLARGCVCKK